MIYVKVVSAEGMPDKAEALKDPVYVYSPRETGQILRCRKHFAQGILSADASVVYQLAGKKSLPRATGTAQIITKAEYEEMTAITL